MKSGDVLIGICPDCRGFSPKYEAMPDIAPERKPAPFYISIEMCSEFVPQLLPEVYRRRNIPCKDFKEALAIFLKLINEKTT